MDKKPTYEELEQKVKELEQKIASTEQMDNALEESDNINQLLQFAPYGVYLIDLSGKIIAANQRGAEHLGKTVTEIAGTTLRDYFSPDIAEDRRIKGIDVVKSGKPLRFEDQIEDSWYNNTIFPILNNQGKIVKLAIYGVDITEYKKALGALSESEEKYKSFIDDAPVAMYTINTKGEFTYGNKMLLEMTGYKTEDWLNKPFHPIVHPEDLDVVIKRIQDRLAGKEIADPYEIRIFNSLGEIIWVKINSRSIYDTDEKGNKKLVGMQSFVEDITDRKLAEEALRESENKFRGLFDFSPQAIALTEIGTGKLVDVNNMFCELTQYAKEEVIGATTTQVGFYSEYDRRRFVNELKASKEVNGLEMDFKAKNGSIINALMFARVIQILGESFILTIFQDVTEQKGLQSQLRQAHKMEAVGTLAGGIAHDFNNILGIILGNTELAMDDVPEWNPAKFNLDEIRTASLRAKDVVRQLLSFARKAEQERKPIKIIPIIEESLKLIRSSIPTSVEIRQKITKDVAIIMAEPTQINQILINLCTNAYHAMANGGILEVTLKNVEFDEDTSTQYANLNPGRYVNLIVSDTGRGIPQEEIDRIFDPYFTTKEVGKGTGMGLAVVHGIVSGYNGTIRVESKVGKGTHFNIFFPAVERDAVVEIETVEEIPKGNESVLFVDDEKSIVNMAQQVLQRLGYQVETKMSPVAALELFRLKPDRFDLIITDMTMPQMTGDIFVKEIFDIRSDIPVILCTGFSEKIDGEKAKKIGASEYIEKPLDVRNFAEMVRKVLDEKE